MSSETSLAQINRARQLLEEARTLESVLDVREKAAAVEAYARAKGADEAQKAALEIKLRAERKAGEFIWDVPREKPPGKDRSQDDTYVPQTTLQEIKKEYGKPNVDRWLKIAEIPKKEFEEYITESKRVSQSAVLGLAKQIDLEKRKKEERQNPAPVDVGPSASSVDIVLGDFRETSPNGHPADLILTDPPYGLEYLDLWDGLGELAMKCLKPGGMLVAYGGHQFIDEQIARVKKSGIEFVWIMALLNGGTQARIHKWGIHVGWKPILLFCKPPYERQIDFTDVMRGDGQDKAHHDWGQAVDESVRLLEMFSEKGDTVLEPMAGGGTVIQACLQTKRNCFAVEKDFTSYTALTERFKNYLRK